MWREWVGFEPLILDRWLRDLSEGMFYFTQLINRYLSMIFVKLEIFNFFYLVIEIACVFV